MMPGHVAAAPPNRLTNSRRLMPGLGSLPGAAAHDTINQPALRGGLRHQKPAGGRSTGPWGRPASRRSDSMAARRGG